MKRAAAYLIAFGLAVMLGWQWSEHRWESRMSQVRLDHAQATTRAVQAALDKQQRLNDSMREVSDAGEKAVADVLADSDGANDSVDRLRRELDAIRARTTRELSSAATQRATDRQTILVLSDLYQRADSRANELAAAFELAHTRGLNCQAAYAATCGE